MNDKQVLATTSLISIVLFSLQFTDDIVRGFERGGLQNLGGVLILAIWLWAAFVLARLRWRYAILLLGSILAARMPVVLMRG